MFRYAFFVLLCTVALSCISATPPAHSQASNPYDFSSPDVAFELDNELREISGITVLSDSLLGAIQDEKAHVYFLNYHTGEIEHEEDFGKNSDYEDIALVGQALYILESDGTLHEVEDWTEKKYDAKRHKTDLESKHDTEGLAFDPVHQRLLIACKEYPGKGLKDTRAIYAFDLETEELLEDPVMVIPLEDFEEFYAKQKQEKPSGLRAFLNRTLDLAGFKPSALALHPVTNEWYVLSSVRKSIVILSNDGQLKRALSLPEDLFAQPEGMAFLPNGDLFISNEGRSGKATLLRFNYRTP